ncbi:hypothetical protein B0H67DRAFT_312006 [Lasiosphaeris hirsuta]|uniref:Copper-fist domain-containing protein n=1 Tax=Lasiosphaeris hirsuta TaxID=260670 RepID=A0AA40DNA1_9PEZI|nr:hypothetical protein B0H67DRAFT_312006 [Lasiosphaeris hirsuta]
MPIINGQKVACAPCIRGHRSTKCNHYNERPMVPVRKPGRPLTTCACPPAKPCSCGGVRVAIPRKQKCGCGPDSTHETQSTPQDPSPTESPTSPTRSSFRVTKPASGPRPNGRKQSFDPVNLHRIDPATVNLLSPNGHGIDVSTVAMAGNNIVAHVSPVGYGGYGAGHPFMPPTPPDPFSPIQALVYGQPLPYDIGLQFSQAHPLLTQEVKAEEENYSSSHATGLITPMLAPSTVNGVGQVAELGPPLIPTATGNAVTGSCCSSNKETPRFNSGDLSTAPQVYEKQAISQFQPSIDLKQQNLPPPFNFQTTFTYPPEYGSWHHPINPEMWSEVASQPNLSLGSSLPAAPINGDTQDLGTSHECGCGEGCKCVGCLAHPFNDEMFDYVNNAYTENKGNTSNGGGGGCCGGGGHAAPTRTQVVVPESPPDAKTPSDGSGLGEEQALSAGDYFFVNIPLRDAACAGNEYSCPCGDDCDCIGCEVHNALPVPAE